MIFIFAIPAYYIGFKTKYMRITIISLVTLCIVLFSKKTYEEYHTLTDPIYMIAYHRALESKHFKKIDFKLIPIFIVVIGVILALLLTRVIWPSVARVQFRKKASKSLHLTSQLYSKVVTIFVHGTPYTELHPNMKK